MEFHEEIVLINTESITLLRDAYSTEVNAEPRMIDGQLSYSTQLRLSCGMEFRVKGHYQLLQNELCRHS